ncbi:MAG TPA: fumarylacetoacetate hydrolase family protein [Bacteroidales bacterium]|nr:fumarylacetoacetate hydrolase family protein [Bacteroidales bacterium]HRZ75887.1 fumarylacetoacetate hydrolase family protein [Bacteroidales bacterium]
MKILCIGRNYREHARELNNPVPEKPVFFMKGSNSLLRNGKPFYYPDFSNDIQYEAELVLRIGRLGKNIAPEFAYSYIDAISLGIDFTARDLQTECKNKGLPWEVAKAFDHAAVLGELKPCGDLSRNIRFQLLLNGTQVQDGHSHDMLFPIPAIIAYLSRFITLRTGDLIYTGTPAGVGPISIGDTLEGFLEGEKVFNLNIK